MIEHKNIKQLHMRTGEPLKKKYMPRDENEKWVRNYTGVLYTGKISNERERSKIFK